jgi:predicted DNA-binding protein with PD1-like motif
LLGDVAVGDPGSTQHLHAVLGKVDGSVVGGHLIEAYVRPALEVILGNYIFDSLVQGCYYHSTN